MNQIYDCIVIGAGVGGMTSAIYLKRAELNICLLEKGAPGGQINKTSTVENYPGFVGDGPTLAVTMFEQVQKLGIDYQYGDVTEIKKLIDSFEIITTTKTYQAKKIILATGRIPNKLGLEKEEKLSSRGISWCAICDGPLFKGQDVAVVGSGNSALEEGIYLASLCNKVIVLNRGNSFKGSKMLVEKMEHLRNVEIHFETTVEELIEQDNRLSGLMIKDHGEIKKLDVTGLFIYIGFQPDTHYLKNMDIKTEHDYILVDDKMQTNIPGIYACGDMIKKDYYQISTAVGEGATAALSVIKELD